MPARSPRRTFLAPFVLTTAALAPAALATPAHAPVHHNPPAQDVETGTTTTWNLTKHATSCEAARDCTGVAKSCSSTPIAYKCPDGIGPNDHRQIMRFANSTVCQLLPDMAGMHCPPGASCNPPPPREVPCPGAK